MWWGRYFLGGGGGGVSGERGDRGWGDGCVWGGGGLKFFVIFR